MPEQVEPLADSIELDRASAQGLYLGGYRMVHPERWTRIREEIRFEDVLALFVPGRALVISCPFHGRDSKPSFHIYRRTNDAFCFGCPPGKQYYDHVRFVAAQHGSTLPDALSWIEKHFELPPIADVDMDEFREGQVEPLVSLTFRDLKDRYIAHAARAVKADPSLAREYLAILFSSWPTRLEAKADPSAGDALALARVLGKRVVAEMLRAKVAHYGAGGVDRG